MTTGSATKVRFDTRTRYEFTTQDVVYRRVAGLDLTATIYRPAGAGPFPAVLDVHGGAWGPENRLQDTSLDEILVASGIVVCSIDFRTSADAPHPAAMEDINYGLRWLKAHAAEYNASPDCVGIVGWSSGGHQVMLSSMRPDTYATAPLDEAPQLDARPAYVIMGWPVIDPLSRYQMFRQRGDLTAEKHIAYYGDEAGMVEANPQLILDRGEKVNLPPALLLQGSDDASLTRFMAERFVESYSRAGGVFELGKYPGSPHSFMRTPNENATRAFAQLRSFIERQLEEQGALES